MSRHTCKMDTCFKVVGGKLVNVCSLCPAGAATAVLGYTPKGAETRYKLRSGEALARKHPSTFEIPDAVSRTSLRKGDYAKLVFEKNKQGERMWVKVTKVEGTGARTRYTGKLDNSPIVIPLKRGATVTFSPRHVINIIAKSHGYTPLTAREKACAKEFIREEMHAFESGAKNIKSRSQAVAIGLSRARRSC